MLIFPDNYSGTVSGNGIAAVNNSSAKYPSDIIPEDIWTSMQDVGVVFLPAAGNRNGSLYCRDPKGVANFNQTGMYWSSTPYLDINACSLHFSRLSVDSGIRSISRNQAYSVRLVTDGK